MSVMVTGNGINRADEFAMSGMGASSNGKQPVETKFNARGAIFGGPGVSVSLPSDLQAMLQKMGLEQDDLRRDLLVSKLANALSMILGNVQLFNDQQQAVLDNILKCEEEIARIENGTGNTVDGELLAGLDLANDPAMVLIQMEIDRLNQMIESMKETPEERRTEEDNKRLKEAEQRKDELEKDRAAKTNESLIKAIKSVESGLIAQLNGENTLALFSALSLISAMARQELAKTADATEVKNLLEGAEQLAVLLGQNRPEELAEFNEMMDDMNSRRVALV